MDPTTSSLDFRNFSKISFGNISVYDFRNAKGNEQAVIFRVKKMRVDFTHYSVQKGCNREVSGYNLDIIGSWQWCRRLVTREEEVCRLWLLLSRRSHSGLNLLR